jgi:hypothetical protein
MRLERGTRLADVRAALMVLVGGGGSKPGWPASLQKQTCCRHACADDADVQFEGAPDRDGEEVVC